jgi:DNA-binding response OmpR family regulator
MKIYLVEDDKVYADFITKSLQDKYNIELFSNAEDCLNAMNGNIPEVLLLDYKLPGMSGIEFFEKITPQIEEDTKVIMLSSIDDGNLVLDFIKKGIRDYVVKDDNVIESLEAVIEGEDDYFFDDFD